ncbi:unnamed protein product [Caenorhabditis brenneri]
MQLISSKLTDLFKKKESVNPRTARTDIHVGSSLTMLDVMDTFSKGMPFMMPPMLIAPMRMPGIPGLVPMMAPLMDLGQMPLNSQGFV